jgi:hypothetical protein
VRAVTRAHQRGAQRLRLRAEPSSLDTQERARGPRIRPLDECRVHEMAAFEEHAGIVELAQRILHPDEATHRLPGFGVPGEGLEQVPQSFARDSGAMRECLVIDRPHEEQRGRELDHVLAKQCGMDGRRRRILRPRSG